MKTQNSKTALVANVVANQPKPPTPHELQMTALARIEAESFAEPETDMSRADPEPPKPQQPEPEKKQEKIEQKQSLKDSQEVKDIIKKSKRERRHGLFSFFKTPPSALSARPPRANDNAANIKPEKPEQVSTQSAGDDGSHKTPRIDDVVKPSASPMGPAPRRPAAAWSPPAAMPKKKQMDIVAPRPRPMSGPGKGEIKPPPIQPIVPVVEATPAPVPPSSAAPSPQLPTEQPLRPIPKEADAMRGQANNLTLARPEPEKEKQPTRHGLTFLKRQRIELKPLKRSHTPRPNIPVSPTGRADIPARPNLTLQLENENLRTAATLLQEDTGIVVPADNSNNEE